MKCCKKNKNACKAQFYIELVLIFQYQYNTYSHALKLFTDINMMFVNFNIFKILYL